LRDIGAVQLGQHHINWKAVKMTPRHLNNADKPSLWAVRNGGFWRVAKPAERVAEYLADASFLPQLPPDIAWAPARPTSAIKGEASVVAKRDLDGLVKSINARLLTTCAVVEV
jgi:hypothetical protein